jgi:beta-mannosidase
MGEQPLYKLRLSFFPDEGRPDCRETTFGIRSIEMAPGPDGKHPDRYDWTFVVNGEPLFAKGTGWCTMDALMDFSRERYDHFLSMAADQHVNLVRAWGGGMPETDDFYDLCDRKGIMVMQEWPTCWGSHDKQPADALEETVRLNTLRLRNHPSLVMWGGGNEIGSGLDSETMDLMGRLSVELDGTRPFHLTDPWGGSTHDHIVWNGWTPAYSFDYYATLDALLLGEYGLASAPNLESVLRFLPDDEANAWPPEPGKSFYHHLPAFNTRDEMRILTEFAESFVRVDSVASFVTGTQLAQATSLRHKMEHARCRWPRETGNIPYKLNDVYPGISWATVDWYGEPKLAHYFSQDAYAPLTACVQFTKLNSPEEDQELPVYVLDDRGELDGEWEARVRVYDPRLRPVSDDRFPGRGPAAPVGQVGTVRLKGDAGPDAPLLAVSEIAVRGDLRHRTFYWFNFDSRQGVLLKLPHTALTLDVRAESGEATVVNAGSYPAVGVELRRGALGGTDRKTFVAEDNFFWLDPGESRTVRVSDVRDLQVRCWNEAERG